ncbi:CGNR zinc finger domain-containing protein [Nocardia sp. CDC153]|uniref:CGNR zinc finger domain-containing protein n=1 Tax=Nocardia sp. CDC153 TaxID=3112167 RepID=UPI002DBF7871|nr:CGNR zinc finger domain-containing protein [Nocardia sp. CDC153]MEC3958316.1 CGNR zinc finger domain-containing protein [Nocardia sp. CDC153]
MSRIRTPVPPFAAFEPGLSKFEKLATQDPRIRAMVSATVSGRLDEACALLNAMLELSGTSVQVRRVPEGWALTTTDAVESAAECVSSLAHLIATDGWRRIKVCEKPSCTQIFIDRTNGSIRLYCDSHRRSADRQGTLREP